MMLAACGAFLVGFKFLSDNMEKLAGKSLKKLFIDRKIPAHLRQSIPILVDDLGILGIPGIGVNLERAAESLPGVSMRCA